MLQHPLFLSLLLSLTLPGTSTSHSNPVPLELARPDGKPGDATKPVQVYLLAGQSNMVGMGQFKGARPGYPKIYLSADPALIEGEMHVGSHRNRGACTWFWRDKPGLRSHGLFLKAKGDDAGATVTVYKGEQKVETAEMKLGQVAESVPTVDGATKTVAEAYLEVPTSGNYLVYVGYGDSSQASAKIGDQEVYRKEVPGEPTQTKIALEAGTRYPLKITYHQPGSAAFWLEQVDLVGKGDLLTLTQKDGKFPYLLDENGEWSVRQDVFYQEARIKKRPGSLLSADSNGGTLGPEVGFGHVMGTFHDEQVLLIKTAMGNRSLKSDFRPPSSEPIDPDSKWEGLEYQLMIEGVNKTLENIAEIVPGYNGQGYEIAGFGWFQGHKDGGSSKENYEEQLVNLIKDVRKDLKAPDMKAVVATVGFEGYRLHTGAWKGVWEAQMAVGDPGQHPEFKGNVASVDSRDFWRELEESPRSEDYHYHRNPEFYLLCGEAMGRAMVRMLGGSAAEMPKSDREEKTIAAMKREAATPEPTEKEIAASIASTKPMVLDGLMRAYLNNERYQKALEGAFVTARPKPENFPVYLDDTVDHVVAFYQEAGIDTYDWKPVLPKMENAEWEILRFDIANNPYDPTESAKAEKGKKAKPAPPEIKLPAGQENWFTPGFNAAKAGWTKAPAPFGKRVPEDWPEEIAWIVKYPLYPGDRPQPATVIPEDVLLMRGTFDLPPAKPGHRYRVRVSGSINANSGEGFAVYANGELMGERKSGLTAWRRQGLSGSPVWSEFKEDFKGGKLDLAVANFPMSNWTHERPIPAIGPLRVWIEEQELPDTTARP